MDDQNIWMRDKLTNDLYSSARAIDHFLIAAGPSTIIFSLTLASFLKSNGSVSGLDILIFSWVFLFISSLCCYYYFDNRARAITSQLSWNNTNNISYKEDADKYWRKAKFIKDLSHSFYLNGVVFLLVFCGTNLIN